MLFVLFVAGLVTLLGALAMLITGYGDDMYTAPLLLGGLAVTYSLDQAS